MKIFLFSFSLLIIYLVNAQENYPFSKWTTKELELARSSDQVTFLDSTEKDILFLCNLVRINPKLFSVTYLQAYIDENELTIKNRYVSSLLETLKSSKSVQVFEADINLYEMAKSHATTMGESRARIAVWPDPQ